MQTEAADPASTVMRSQPWVHLRNYRKCQWKVRRLHECPGHTRSLCQEELELPPPSSWPAPLISTSPALCTVSVASASSSSTEKGSCSACGGAAEEDRAHDPLRAGLRLQGVFPMLFCTQKVIRPHSALSSSHHLSRSGTQAVGCPGMQKVDD